MAHSALADACGLLRRSQGQLGSVALELLPEIETLGGSRSPAPLLQALRTLLASASAITAERPLLLDALRVALVLVRAPRQNLLCLTPASNADRSPAADAARHAWATEAHDAAAQLLCQLIALCDAAAAASLRSGDESVDDAIPLEYAVVRAHYDVCCSYASHAAFSSGVDGAGASTAGPSRWAAALSRLRAAPLAVREECERGVDFIAGEPTAAGCGWPGRAVSHSLHPEHRWAAAATLASLDTRLAQLSALLLGAAARPADVAATTVGSGVSALHWLADLLPRAATLGCGARDGPIPTPAASLLLPPLRTMGGPAWASAVRMATTEIGYWRSPQLRYLPSKGADEPPPPPAPRLQSAGSFPPPTAAQMDEAAKDAVVCAAHLAHLAAIDTAGRLATNNRAVNGAAVIAPFHASADASSRQNSAAHGGEEASGGRGGAVPPSKRQRSAAATEQRSALASGEAAAEEAVYIYIYIYIYILNIDLDLDLDLYMCYTYRYIDLDLDLSI